MEFQFVGFIGPQIVSWLPADANIVVGGPDRTTRGDREQGADVLIGQSYPAARQDIVA